MKKQQFPPPRRANFCGIDLLNWANSLRFAHLDIFPDDPAGFYDYCTGKAEVDGLWLEFGVCTGNTIRRLSTLMKEGKKSEIMYGFDSFQGLPESWRVDADLFFPKGETFGTQPGYVPTIPNCEMVVGWFEDTLPEFVKVHQKSISLIHIDCDLYSSTKTIFKILKDHFVPGTIILFDEFYNYQTYREHEYKAFMEFIEETNFGFEIIAHTNGQQLAVRLLPTDFKLYNEFRVNDNFKIKSKKRKKRT